MTDLLAAIAARLHSARRVAILTHQRPDPDALGSQAALALLLQKFPHHEALVVNFEAPPRPYAFLQEGVTAVPFSTDLLETCDTIAAVDTCTYQQLEPAAVFLKTHPDRIVAIDHHLSRDPLSPLIYADPSAASCAQLIAELAPAFGVPLDAAIATRLFAGLAADTGWFRFDNVEPRALQTAADLVAAGAVPAALYERLQQCETQPKLALIQRALASLLWSAGNRVAIMTLLQKDFAETGAVASQTEEIVNLPLLVGSVEVVALVTETPEGRVRASLRSKHDVDVNAICRQFSGGGHARAAGCRLEGPVPTARARLLTAIEKALP